jgi:hypothetical protein
MSAHAAEMDPVAFHILIAFALLWCWLALTGRIAEWSWRIWGEGRSRGGVLGWDFGDLRSLKRYHFWMALITLAVLLFMYSTFVYGYVRAHWSTTTSNRAMQLTANELVISASGVRHLASALRASRSGARRSFRSHHSRLTQ